jgi:hypothetical protein
MRYRSSAKKKTKSKSDGFVPPANVAAEAAKGLKYRAKASPSQKGGLTPAQAAKHGIGSGVQRAVNLKNRNRISFKVIKQMFAFFSRHKKNKAINPEFRNEPWKDKGYVAWLLWGGDSGFAWAKKIINQIEKQEKKAAQVGTDTATIYAIAPESLYHLIQKKKWMESAESMWGDGDHDPKAWDKMTKILRQSGGAYFTTGRDGDWDVKVPGSITEEGYLPPYGTSKFATIIAKVASKHLNASSEALAIIDPNELEYLRGNVIDIADRIFDAAKAYQFHLNTDTMPVLLRIWSQFGDKTTPLIKLVEKVVRDQHQKVYDFVSGFFALFNRMVPSKYRVSDGRPTGYPDRWAKDYINLFEQLKHRTDPTRYPWFSSKEKMLRSLTAFLPNIKDQYEYVSEAINYGVFEDLAFDFDHEPKMRRALLDLDEATAPAYLQSLVDAMSRTQYNQIKGEIDKLTKGVFR